MPELPAFVPELVARLAAVPGVLGVALGGSYATGTATPSSDLDLSLAYSGAATFGGSPGFDLAALRTVCLDLDDAGLAEPSAVGGWGPWVDGGAWLTVQGRRVDFIYRDLLRVEKSVQDAQNGVTTLHTQPGHPHGIHAHHYAAELASCVVPHDPSGSLSALKERVREYPPALARALQSHYGWQKGFWLDCADKGLKRGDLHYVQGCLYQSVMSLVQEICAVSQVWLLNEKGALLRAAGQEAAPPDLVERVNQIILTQDIAAMRVLNEEIRLPTTF